MEDAILTNFEDSPVIFSSILKLSSDDTLRIEVVGFQSSTIPVAEDDDTVSPTM